MVWGGRREEGIRSELGREKAEGDKEWYGKGEGWRRGGTVWGGRRVEGKRSSIGMGTVGRGKKKTGEGRRGEVDMEWYEKEERRRGEEGGWEKDCYGGGGGKEVSPPCSRQLVVSTR